MASFKEAWPCAASAPIHKRRAAYYGTAVSTLPDALESLRAETGAMMKTLIEKIAWCRHGVRTYFVGALRACDEGIRLTGRDTSSGIDVSLSIPLAEVERVRVSASDELLAGEPCVVLDLAGSEPIFLRQIGVSPLHVDLLARRLGALTNAPSLLAQGG
jgi:hypothetical protein